VNTDPVAASPKTASCSNWRDDSPGSERSPVDSRKSHIRKTNIHAQIVRTSVYVIMLEATERGAADADCRGHAGEPSPRVLNGKAERLSVADEPEIAVWLAGVGCYENA
jgi:hypothetical protein